MVSGEHSLAADGSVLSFEWFNWLAGEVINSRCNPFFLLLRISYLRAHRFCCSAMITAEGDESFLKRAIKLNFLKKHLISWSSEPSLGWIKEP